MRKSKILKKLDLRILAFTAKIALLEKGLYDKDSNLDIEVYRQIQFYRTEIHLTNKKIAFVNQGKCYLGSAFPSHNIDEA